VHELSIVQTLIEQVQGEVERAGVGGRITRVALAIGRLSGVNPDAMRFAFQMLAPGTVVQEAELSIAEPKATCACRHCGARAEVDELLARCPACGSEEVSIEGGRDLLLQSIDVEEQTDSG
jgi:hydrogenase nickel incorporation protein HypA/HybF